MLLLTIYGQQATLSLKRLNTELIVNKLLAIFAPYKVFRREHGYGELPISLKPKQFAGMWPRWAALGVYTQHSRFTRHSSQNDEKFLALNSVSYPKKAAPLGLP